MSVYKLSENITFNSSSLTLMSDHENVETIAITHSSSRCLVALLEAKGNVISRDDLLQIGWGYAGLVVTSNSLSQVIALLRKSFKEIGLENVTIVTVSKLGYRLTTQQSGEAELITLRGNCPILVQQSCPPRLEGKIKKPLYYLFIAAFTTVLFFIFFKDLHASKSLSTVEYSEYQNKNDYSILIQNGISTDSEYFKEAITLINNDKTLKESIKKNSFIYINKSMRKYSHIFFVCNDSIKTIKEPCTSVFIVTVNG